MATLSLAPRDYFQRATPNHEVQGHRRLLPRVSEIEIEWIELDPALRRQLQSSFEAGGNFAKIHKSSSRTTKCDASSLSLYNHYRC